MAYESLARHARAKVDLARAKTEARPKVKAPTPPGRWDPARYEVACRLVLTLHEGLRLLLALDADGEPDGVRAGLLLALRLTAQANSACEGRGGVPPSWLAVQEAARRVRQMGLD